MVKLNVGCGHDYREGYINIDGSDTLPNVDKIIDLSKESLLDYFEEKSVREILARDFIEHFFHWEAEKILSEFFLLLKSDGRLKLKLPDFDYICKTWRMSSEEKITYLYGGQDKAQGKNKDNYRKKFPEFFCHKYGYTQKTMRQELAQIGFRQVKTKRKGKNFYVEATR
ncbi:MAG: class I SAM-dependent methyltransferase [Fibrobacterota bacterium]